MINPGLVNPYRELLTEPLQQNLLPKELIGLTCDYLDLEITITELFLRSLAVEYMQNNKTTVVDDSIIWGEEETRNTATIWGSQVRDLDLGHVQLLFRMERCPDNFYDYLVTTTLNRYFKNVTRFVQPSHIIQNWNRPKDSATCHEVEPCQENDLDFDIYAPKAYLTDKRKDPRGVSPPATPLDQFFVCDFELTSKTRRLAIAITTKLPGVDINMRPKEKALRNYEVQLRWPQKNSSFLSRFFSFLTLTIPSQSE